MPSQTYILTTPHEKGPHVAAFQRALAKAGYYHGDADGEYGPLTAQAVYRAKYRLGYAKPDQAAGDVLYSYLTGTRKPTAAMAKLAVSRKPKPQVKTLGAKALDAAFKDVGYVEHSINGHGNYNKFGKRYGADGVAWCCEFVTCKMVDAGSKAFVLGRNYAYVPTMYGDALSGRNHLTLVKAGQVQYGDVIAFDWPGESRGTADHTGFFVKWLDQSRGTFETVEGNTSPSNNSNGGMVMHRTDRNLGEVLTERFIRVGA